MKNYQNQLASPKGEDKKSRRDLILGISNLILTAIIGIGVAIYLNYRDEQIQKNLITIQAETERQSNLAHLQVSPTCLYYGSCSGSFSIKNLGAAHAKNVKVIVILEYVNEDWTSVISDIKYFSIKTLAPSLDITTSSVKIDTLYLSPVAGYNAYEISIANIPPQDEVNILLERYQSTLTQSHTANFPATIYVNSDDPIDQLALHIHLKKYLEKRFNVAGFSINTSCENCEGNIDKPIVVVSSLGGWGLSTIDYSEFDSGFNWNINMFITFEKPKDIIFVPNNDPIYLKSSVSSDGEFILQETNP